MKRKTQLEIIRNRLLKGHYVSTIGAVTGQYGTPILRLSDTIFKLRNEGLRIKTIDVRNRTNGGSTARYVLETK